MKCEIGWQGMTYSMMWINEGSDIIFEQLIYFTYGYCHTKLLSYWHMAASIYGLLIQTLIFSDTVMRFIQVVFNLLHEFSCQPLGLLHNYITIIKLSDKEMGVSFNTPSYLLGCLWLGQTKTAWLLTLCHWLFTSHSVAHYSLVISPLPCLLINIKNSI